VFTLRATKNSKIRHAAPQVCVCSYVPYNMLQISHNVPQRTPWHFRLGSFHYSKLIWVLILVKISKRVKTVWPFPDNATWNLILKSFGIIRRVQLIGSFWINISSSAPVEELDCFFESGKISSCLFYVLCLCRENIDSFFAGGRKSSSVSVIWNGMCNGGMFVLKGFRCSSRDNFKMKGFRVNMQLV